MRTVLPIALVMSMVACHHVRSGVEPARRNGDFAFRISISGQDPVRGMFTVLPDTVLVETAGQDCRHEPGRVGPENLHRFSCFPPPGMEGFAITIDPNHPSLSRWSGTQSVMKTRTVCVRYTTNSRGQTVCAESRSENYFETLRTGGTLNLTAVDTVRSR